MQRAERRAVAKRNTERKIARAIKDLARTAPLRPEPDQYARKGLITWDELCGLLSGTLLQRADGPKRRRVERLLAARLRTRLAFTSDAMPSNGVRLLPGVPDSADRFEPEPNYWRRTFGWRVRFAPPKPKVAKKRVYKRATVVAVTRGEVEVARQLMDARIHRERLVKETTRKAIRESTGW